MKKALSVVIGSTLLVGFAATSAFALHGTIPAETSVTASSNAKVTLDGEIRMRGYSKSTSTAVDSANGEGYDGRVRLGVKAVLSDEANGYIQLETGDQSGDTYTWGDGTSSGLMSGGSKQGGCSSTSTTTVNGTTHAATTTTTTTCKDSTDLSILQAWINYQPGKFGFKVGHMPLALGNNLFFDHTGSGDDAIVAYMNPSDATHIAALTVKFEEGSTSPSADDIDGYVALMTQKMGGMNLGANVTYLNMDGDLLSFYNLGVDLSGKAGAASFKVDVEYQFGDDGGALGTGGTTTTQYGMAGYAVMASADVKAGAMTVGGLVGYGTGEDDLTDQDYGGFVNFLTDTRYQSTMVGYILATPSLGKQGSNSQKNTGLSNLMLIQANVSTKATCPITKKDLDLKARVNYMELNEVAAGWDDKVGVELEAFATWKLSNGLSYGIEAAYLIADDAWKAGSTTAEVDDVYFLRHNLTLKF